jgi:OPA family glycerol-3-phosphate transporter-like MFS transporter
MRGTKRRWLIVREVLLFALIVFGAVPALAGGGNEAKPWYTGFTPILLLLGAIALVIWRLPGVKEEFPGQLAHLQDTRYRMRRMWNWVLLGATYAFLYWGRYNLNVAIETLGGKQMVEDFNWVFGAGTAVYGASFLLNGPLTDRLGGRFSILVSACGAAVANLAMGVACGMHAAGKISAEALFWWLIVLYAVNMYFQSFGAVAIVKCNAAWFHVRERGVFGAIFGILISLGIYFAFDWSFLILRGFKLPVAWAFLAPAAALGVTFTLDLLVVRNRPSEAGFTDIRTGDATSGEGGPPDPPLAVFRMMAQDRVIMTIASIEFCSGFLRQAIMQLYRLFAKMTGGADSFVYENWGMLLCVAGILGGVFAGTISDRVFGSRRGPVAAVLYVGLLLGALGMGTYLSQPYVIGYIAIAMSLCVIGVHGMLSGTASMDFGGVKNAGIAVGIIDGFVYAGTALQAMLYAKTLPEGGAAAKDPDNWWFWPVAMVPIACIGLALSYRIRNERPKPKRIVVPA